MRVSTNPANIWTAILTPACTLPLLLATALCTVASLAAAQSLSDGVNTHVSADSAASAPDANAVMLEMSEAYRRGDKARLAGLLPLVQGHALEPWAAYWALKARLEEASPDEVRAFLTRWAGTYQEDRLRNDWLLLSGKRRDWASFAVEYPRFRMRDDAQVRCYALAADASAGKILSSDAAAQLQQDWLGQRNQDDGCLLAAGLLHASGQLPAAVLWAKARQAVQDGRPALARAVVALAAPDAAAIAASLLQNPARYLSQQASASTLAAPTVGRELVLLALLKLATQSPEQAIQYMQNGGVAALTPAQRNLAWALLGKWAAIKQPDLAWSCFAQATQDGDLDDHLLAWKARAALRQGQWGAVLSAVNAMRQPAQDDGAWLYWRARARLAMARSEDQRAAAQAAARVDWQALTQAPAGQGFYEKLAREALGGPSTLPAAPLPLSLAERESARNHIGLNRALLAITLGLRSEGVREWNYWIRLHTPGGMDDRQLYAAADLACRYQVWDRCISTSERIRGFADMVQRYPVPYRDAVRQQAQASGLDPAYVYGLIRQESRFVTDARSHVGASGLMQIMPATARWTAHKIGLEGFSPSQLGDLHTNLFIGISYLKLALDDFQNSLPLAAAAYNAGPGRARVWRNGPALEGAIWVENIPFTETRDYVKQVLSNTTDYARLFSGQPQSLQQRLGQIAPPPPDVPDPSRDLP